MPSPAISYRGPIRTVGPREPHTNFDFQSLEPREPDDESQEKLLQLLDKIVTWIYPKRTSQRSIALRVKVLIWFLKPSWLGDANLTQVELGKRLGLSKANTNKLVGLLHKEFGFHKAGMRNPEARQKLRHHATVSASRLTEARRLSYQRKAATMPPEAHRAIHATLNTEMQ